MAKTSLVDKNKQETRPMAQYVEDTFPDSRQEETKGNQDDMTQ